MGVVITETPVLYHIISLRGVEAEMSSTGRTQRCEIYSESPHGKVLVIIMSNVATG